MQSDQFYTHTCTDLSNNLITTWWKWSMMAWYTIFKFVFLWRLLRKSKIWKTNKNQNSRDWKRARFHTLTDMQWSVHDMFFLTKWRHTWPLLGAPAVLRDVEHSGVYTPNWNWVSPKTSAQAKILLLQIQHIRSIHIQGQGLHDIQRWSSPQREKDQKRCISGVYRFWWYEIQDTILVDLTCALSKEPDNLRSEECLRGGSVGGEL